MTATMEFELTCRRSHPDLPEKPASFRVIRGSYGRVSEEAVRLNKVHNGLTTPDYLFFPEAVAASNPLHCDICKRLAVRDALED